MCSLPFYLSLLLKQTHRVKKSWQLPLNNKSANCQLNQLSLIGIIRPYVPMQRQ